MERQNAEEVDLAVKAKTINWNYTKSLAGFVKLLLILAQIGNWWSIAVSPVSINGTVTMNVSTVAIRDATLFFSLSGLVHSVALYSLNLFNVYNISKFSFYKFSSLLIVFLSEKSHFISSSVLASFAWNELQKLSKTGSYDPFSGSTGFGYGVAFFHIIDMLLLLMPLVFKKQKDKKNKDDATAKLTKDPKENRPSKKTSKEKDQNN